MCTKPLKAVCVSLNENGKKKLHFIKDENKNYNYNDEIIYVPCGHCIECRLEKSRDWANRMYAELQYHKVATFVTLTYDNDHLPYGEKYVDNEGKERRNPTLIKKDAQTFIRSLRDYIGHNNRISYYLCGEYGDRTFRPHFHAIIFGYWDYAAIPWNKVDNFSAQTYISPELMKIWKKGNVICSSL